MGQVLAWATRKTLIPAMCLPRATPDTRLVGLYPARQGRALQAYRGVAPADEARLTKSAGFADTLIVFKALRIASDAGETLNGVCTFDAAMQRFSHTAPL